MALTQLTQGETCACEDVPHFSEPKQLAMNVLLIPQLQPSASLDLLPGLH